MFMFFKLEHLVVVVVVDNAFAEDALESNASLVDTKKKPDSLNTIAQFDEAKIKRDLFCIV